MEFSGHHRRDDVVNMLRRGGLTKLAEEALRDLPDRVEADQLAHWCSRHGLTRDEMTNLLGGSP